MEQTAITESITCANRFLVSAQNAGSGWGYSRRNKQTFIEPTCWALLSLSAQVHSGPAADPEASAAYDRGLACLLSAQLEDGSWTNAIDTEAPGDIRTALAVWTLATGVGDPAETADPLARGLDWLMQNRPGKGGWAWCYGAYSVVEPTALAVLALHETQRLEPVREELVQYVLDLQCDDGGWNSHSRKMLGVPQSGMLSVTPVALIALAKLGLGTEHEAVARALAYLDEQSESTEYGTNYTRVLWLWALSVLGLAPGHETASDTLAALVASQTPEGHWDASIFVTALAGYALQRIQS